MSDTTETSSRHWLIMYDGYGQPSREMCDCAIGDDHGPTDPIPAADGAAS